jgi:hypothetical protein
MVTSKSTRAQAARASAELHSEHTPGASAATGAAAGSAEPGRLYGTPLGEWLRVVSFHWFYRRGWAVERIAQGLGVSPDTVNDLLAGRAWCSQCGATDRLASPEPPLCRRCLLEVEQELLEGVDA